jgi:hypothetical protein
MRPLVLLFDESYDSHADFQAWRGKKALNDADVLVFVGTSFSVGITSSAVRCAEVSGAKMINVNVEPSPFPQMMNVLGGAEVLLRGGERRRRRIVRAAAALPKPQHALRGAHRGGQHLVNARAHGGERH